MLFLVQRELLPVLFFHLSATVYRMTSAYMSEDVRWLFDRYVLLLNAKLRERGRKDEKVERILGAIVAQFLIENQREILDEYKLYSEKRLERALPRLRFKPSDIAAVCPPKAVPDTGGTQPATNGGDIPGDDAGRPDAPVKYSARFDKYRTKGNAAARRVAGRNKILQILAP